MIWLIVVALITFDSELRGRDMILCLIMQPADIDAFVSGELRTIESLISKSEVMAPEISQVPVSWHLYHMLKVINGIYTALDKSDTGQYKWRPNLARTFVWATGWMKRGVGRSPQSVRPPEQYGEVEIIKELELATYNIQQFNELPGNAWFNHFAFGPLGRDNAFRFVRIHTRHHLAIIQDILARASRGS